MAVLTVPNLLSAARLASVPAILWLIVEDRIAAAFWVFALAALTDALDGALARLLRARSLLGSYLDPIADKAMLVSAFLALAWQGHIAVWLAALVLLRELMIAIGALLVIRRGIGAGQGIAPAAPIFISKVNTAAQIALVVLVMAQAAFSFSMPSGTDLVSWLCAATTLVSGWAYAMAFLRRQCALGREAGS